ncbi:hypothetical protein NLG97_g771 [Lecanicillium saksenae]|uniref:Uncharacterized protein n=1 Tax=Lecanicillium saksenae TaxID=468837 RepID=A0ACC1R7I7_9HYPO|nr:hypothetical protein NLG97_g771 [Lecanicillium saksenae]
MVVLADELLEQFFESSFPLSFHIVEGVPDTLTAPGSLTTFSSLGFGSRHQMPPQVGPLGAGRGLRGVLDNIVTDGMRVATEVRRRMEEAQRELEKNAVPGQRADDDEDDEDDMALRTEVTSGRSADIERRSVRSSDRDLLDGADASAGASSKEAGERRLVDIDPEGSDTKPATHESAGVVEFDT